MRDMSRDTQSFMLVKIPGDTQTQPSGKNTSYIYSTYIVIIGNLQRIVWAYYLQFLCAGRRPNMDAKLLVAG